MLDRCPLCYRDDGGGPSQNRGAAPQQNSDDGAMMMMPVAPVVSLATRVYLTLPPEPELSARAATIVPLQHRGNLLECDDDEWEEIRVRKNMKRYKKNSKKKKKTSLLNLSPFPPCRLLFSRPIFMFSKTPNQKKTPL